MIVIKTKAELEKMRRSGMLVHDILKALGEMAKEGISTWDLEVAAVRMMQDAGAKPAFKGYYVAAAGERFTVDGREVFVRPLPVQPLHDMLYAGGGVAASARRAARFNLGFVPMRQDLFTLYDEECRRLGREPGRKIGPYGPILIHVADDPDAEKVKLERHVLHHAQSYAKWAAEGSTGTSNYTGMEDPAVIWKSGRYRIVTPDACVALVQALEGTGASLVMQPLIAGLDPDIGWRSLELFAKSVMPRLL